VPVDAGTVLLVLTTLPDRAAALKLAQMLVDARLAACVNVGAPCISVYRWQGAVEEADEVPVLIKSTVERYAELETVLHRHHPYELPEILAVRPDRGLPDYLEWVMRETAVRNQPRSEKTMPHE